MGENDVTHFVHGKLPDYCTSSWVTESWQTLVQAVGSRKAGRLLYKQLSHVKRFIVPDGDSHVVVLKSVCAISNTMS